MKNKSKKKKNLAAKIFAISLLIIMIGSMIAGLLLK